MLCFGQFLVKDGTTKTLPNGRGLKPTSCEPCHERPARTAAVSFARSHPKRTYKKKRGRHATLWGP